MPPRQRRLQLDASRLLDMHKQDMDVAHVPLTHPHLHLEVRLCWSQVGCGAGNTVYPLLNVNPQLRVYACDFSPKAVQLVQAHPAYASGISGPHSGPPQVPPAPKAAGTHLCSLHIVRTPAFQPGGPCPMHPPIMLSHCRPQPPPGPAQDCPCGLPCCCRPRPRLCGGPHP